MTATYYHAKSSARHFGGVPEDYLAIHDWFDATKELFADCRHRALRHHSHGIFECERVFGNNITNSDGKVVPVRLIGELHVREDCGGRIPSVEEWLSLMPIKSWMNKAVSFDPGRCALRIFDPTEIGHEQTQS